MRAWAIATLLLLTAGCLTQPLLPEGPPQVPDVPGTTGVVHRAGGAWAPADGLVQALGGQYSTGLDSTEPTIGVDRAGNVDMVAFRDSEPLTAVSSDQGQTWKGVAPTVADRATHPTSFDPYVYVDTETGRVFMDDLTPPCNLLSWSDDQGKSWTTNPVACGSPQLNDHQTIVVAKPRRLVTSGYPNLVYFCANQVNYASCAVSINGGLSFLPQVPVGPTVPGSAAAAATGGCLAITGHLEADHQGRVFLGFPCGGHPHVAVTEDDGLTWTLHTISATAVMSDHDVDFAVDEADGVYAVWSGDDGKIWYSHSEDHGAAWAPALDVTAPGVTATMFAAVAAGAEGRVAFAYVGTTIPGGYEGKPLGNGGVVGDLIGEPDPPEWANATWNAYVGLMLDARAPDPLIQSVTANDPRDPLARGLCGGTRCHGMNDFLDIAVDAEGRPWASFVDVCTKTCVSNPEIHWDTSLGFAGALQAGPSLRGGQAALPVIRPPPV
jgi:hypothetical protein